MRSWSAVVVALAAGVPAAAQQILEVDTEAGRELVGGAEYSFYHTVVDYGRRLVLAAEAADPRAVTAYSLDDGSVQYVFGGGRAGDGPGELPHLEATAVGPDGVFMSGRGRVLHWSWSGALLPEWRPTAPPGADLCALNGRPALTVQKGVVFRGDDGESVVLGEEARTSLHVATPSAIEDAITAYFTTKLACADSAAYVLAGNVHVLTEYKLGAEPRLVAMPAELVEAAREEMESADRNSAYSNLFLADDGRLVITTVNARLLAGAVLDRATGCYALLRNRPWTSHVTYVGMFGDSVVTAESSRQPMATRMVDGKRVRVFSSERTHIFVRPVRPVSGEPCA